MSTFASTLKELDLGLRVDPNATLRLMDIVVYKSHGVDMARPLDLALDVELGSRVLTSLRLSEEEAAHVDVCPCCGREEL